MKNSRLPVLLSLVLIYTPSWGGKEQVVPLYDQQEPGRSTSITQAKKVKTPAPLYLTCRFILASPNHGSIIVFYNGVTKNGITKNARPIPEGTRIWAGLHNPFWKYHDKNPNVGPRKIDLGNYTIKEELQPGQSTAIERDFSSDSQYINRAWPCFVESIKVP